MPDPIDLRLDVTGAVPLPGPLHIAATVFLPEPGRLNARPAVIFASPGGGYGRGYFDMSFPGHEGYSQAAYHTARGDIVVAYDHLGVGDSSLTGLSEMTIEMIADANAAAVRAVCAMLEQGKLSPDLAPLPAFAKVGIGQSMGGGVSIIMQGRQAPFDAIAPLGYSAIHTVLPQRTKAEQEAGARIYQFSRDTPGSALSVEGTAAEVPDFVYPFHWEDVPADILEADMAGGYPLRHSAPAWGSRTIPNCVVAMMSPGYVAQEAARVTVPVLIGCGERDVLPTPRIEPAAFSQATDIAVFIAPTMAHMHNFAGTRALLWRRIDSFVRQVAENPG